jgi:hypothetical protein
MPRATKCRLSLITCIPQCLHWRLLSFNFVVHISFPLLHVPARHKHGAPFADLLPGHHITSAPYHKLSIDIACRHFSCPQKAFYFSNLKTRLVFQLGHHVQLQRLRFFWTRASTVEPSVVGACQSNANWNELCETGWKPTHTEIVSHQQLLFINLKSPNT